MNASGDSNVTRQRLHVFEKPETFGDEVKADNVKQKVGNTVNFSSNMSSLCFDYTQKLMLSGMFSNGYDKEKIASTVESI